MTGTPLAPLRGHLAAFLMALLLGGCREPRVDSQATETAEPAAATTTETTTGDYGDLTKTYTSAEAKLREATEKAEKARKDEEEPE
ncbi:MAG TPA: hypothetical protein VMT00_08120 [Thermoanaerobaculia bacterium]|nr:hypothetical protein [Thermoanaerobaculia bacterium]